MSTAVPPPAGKVNYGGNSKVAQENAKAVEEAKAERTPLQKLEGVEVVQTKPTLGSRFAKTFGGDNLKNVGKTVVMEVLIPGARDILFDMVKEGAHRALYGDSVRRVGSSSGIGQTIVGSVIKSTNYSGMSSAPIMTPQNTTPQLSQQQKAQFDFSGLVFPHEAMAIEVLEKLNDAIQEFNIVPVADFYDLIGQTGNGFTDQKYGWNAQAFQGAEVRRVRNGFILSLPAPRAIA